MEMDPLGPYFIFLTNLLRIWPSTFMASLYAETVSMLEQLLPSCLGISQKTLEVLEPSSGCQPATQNFIF